ncbi:hypothetical protein [Caulobacter sp. 17J65-9]|uniref:hypothetical protein n=1 Tax=Caulobacter sp. 17J65-9 TaxID=2709382 RepID=UPI0013C7A14B|nr:hypothetical protein [Caulobacter sp. 17J65-9]NEX91188.1 hypothetical protein [Caulobacter sp. 17J65-9]
MTMQFFDVLPSAGDQPTVQASKTQVIFSVPVALAKRVGIEAGGHVHLQYGEEGDTRAVRLAPAEGQTEWKAVGRKNLIQVFAKQLMPKTEIDKTPVSHSTDRGAVILNLPTAWKLASPDVVDRDGTAKTRRR